MKDVLRRMACAKAECRKQGVFVEGQKSRAATVLFQGLSALALGGLLVVATGCGAQQDKAKQTEPAPVQESAPTAPAPPPSAPKAPAAEAVPQDKKDGAAVEDAEKPELNEEQAPDREEAPAPKEEAPEDDGLLKKKGKKARRRSSGGVEAKEKKEDDGKAKIDPLIDR